ncbi:hypothetical protein CKO50_21315 [Pseudoalteromonas sp. HM-SA03]|nr:hypothetical protein CKO50_21315 [Pseudoalteromonas sp. HM-SA03]
MGLIQRMLSYMMNEWDIYLPGGNPVAPVSLPPRGVPVTEDCTKISLVLKSYTHLCPKLLAES